MRRWSMIALVAAACRDPAPPAPRPTPASAPTRRASAPAPATESSLVLVVPDGADCALRRVDPVGGASIDLARIPGTCLGARISWRADLRRAVIWFQPHLLHSGGIGGVNVPAPGHPEEQAAVTERHVEVDLDTGKSAALTLPAERPDELAYGADGALFAFTARDLPDVRQAKVKKVTVEGRNLDFSDVADGLPAAAIAYRRDGQSWKLASVVETTTGWDYARGWSAAPEAATTGPRSIALLEAHAATQEISNAAAKPALDKIAPPQGEGGDGWAELATAHGPVYVWMFNAEFVHTTGRIAWPGGKGGAIELLPGLDFTAGELVAVRVRGRYLLVAGAGAGAHPRLYDLKDHRRVWASDSARAVTLWPPPVDQP